MVAHGAHSYPMRFALTEGLHVAKGETADQGGCTTYPASLSRHRTDLAASTSACKAAHAFSLLGAHLDISYRVIPGICSLSEYFSPPGCPSVCQQPGGFQGRV